MNLCEPLKTMKLQYCSRHMINNYSELIKKLPRKYSTHRYYNTSFSMNLRSKINVMMSIRFKSVFICKIKVKNNVCYAIPTTM